MKRDVYLKTDNVVVSHIPIYPSRGSEDGKEKKKIPPSHPRRVMFRDSFPLSSATPRPFPLPFFPPIVIPFFHHPSPLSCQVMPCSKSLIHLRSRVEKKHKENDDLIGSKTIRKKKEQGG